MEERRGVWVGEKPGKVPVSNWPTEIGGGVFSKKALKSTGMWWFWHQPLLYRPEFRLL